MLQVILAQDHDALDKLIEVNQDLASHLTRRSAEDQLTEVKKSFLSTRIEAKTQDRVRESLLRLHGDKN